MKTIFYNYPVGTEKVAATHSNNSVEELKAEGIIPNNAVTVVYDLIDENSDHNTRPLYVFVDRIKFDNIENPTLVKFDRDLLYAELLQDARGARAQQLQKLDNLQLRAMAKGLTDVVADIEADKEIMRNLPDNINFNSANNYSDAFSALPRQTLGEDLEEKYRERLL
jgi:hypothetical protein